jgi:transcriptional regulator with XRE-family HTH domain
MVHRSLLSVSLRVRVLGDASGCWQRHQSAVLRGKRTPSEARDDWLDPALAVLAA